MGRLFHFRTSLRARAGHRRLCRRAWQSGRWRLIGLVAAPSQSCRLLLGCHARGSFEASAWNKGDGDALFLFAKALDTRTGHDLVRSE